MTQIRINLRPSSFPFVLQALHPETRAVVWTKTIEGPGEVYIPPLAQQFGHPVLIRAVWPDGTFSEQQPERYSWMERFGSEAKN